MREPKTRSAERHEMLASSSRSRCPLSSGLQKGNRQREDQRMKRAAELRGLSDDHHQGLVQAKRLRRAASGEAVDLADDARAFLRFWQKETSAHFRKEEEALLPVLARYGEDVGQEPVVEMLTQHARIRGLVMQLSDEITEG